MVNIVTICDVCSVAEIYDSSYLDDLLFEIIISCNNTNISITVRMSHQDHLDSYVTTFNDHNM